MFKAVDCRSLMCRLIVCAILTISILDVSSVYAAAPADSVAWVDYERGVTTAKETGKPVFLFFYGNWCRYCTKMRDKVFTDTAVIRNLNAYFVPIMIETQSNRQIIVDRIRMTEADFAIKKFNAHRVPATWFLEPDGCRILKLKGYRPVSDLLENMKNIQLRQYGKCTNVSIDDPPAQPKPAQTTH